MPYPPTIPLADVNNTTPMVDRHPVDHNAITNALRDMVNELGDNPSGLYPTVQARFDGAVSIGEIREYAHINALPLGFMVCDGVARSRTTYALLFAKIGTVWGGGDGSTTFNFPLLIDRFSRGSAANGSNRGQSGGQADAIIPAHTHPGRSATESVQHTHDSGARAGYNIFNGPDGALMRPTAITYNQLPAAPGQQNTGVEQAAHAHEIFVDSANGGEAVTGKNLPPYGTVIKAIFTGVI